MIKSISQTTLLLVGGGGLIWGIGKTKTALISLSVFLRGMTLKSGAIGVAIIGITTLTYYLVNFFNKSSEERERFQEKEKASNNTFYNNKLKQYKNYTRKQLNNEKEYIEKQLKEKQSQLEKRIHLESSINQIGGTVRERFNRANISKQENNLIRKRIETLNLRKKALEETNKSLLKISKNKNQLINIKVKTAQTNTSTITPDNDTSITKDNEDFTWRDNIREGGKFSYPLLIKLYKIMFQKHYKV